MVYNESMPFPTTTIRFQVIPGTITLDDGSVASYTYNDLITLYNVDPLTCILGPVAGIDEARYIKLKPRADAFYDDMNFQTQLGKSIVIGPNFDGSKKFTQETNRETFYSKRESEPQL